MTLQFDINRLNLRELNNGFASLKLCFIVKGKEVQVNITLDQIKQNKIEQIIYQNTASLVVSNIRVMQKSLIDGSFKYHEI